MKRILKSIAIVAAAAMSFAACQKEVAPQEKTEQGLYKYTFNVVDGEAKVDAETKAILGDSNVEWVSGDQVGVFIADNVNYANMDVTGTPVKAVLYSSSAIPAGTMVYGFYPYNELNKTSEDYSKDFALISFAAAQHGKATSSMPLAGVPFEVQEELAASAKTGNGELKFLNLGSIVNFKVWSANQDEQSETVQYIVFTANDNAKIAGDAVIDLTAVDPANASTLAVTFMDGVSSVKVEQESSVASAKGSGEGVKMVIAPGTFSGTLKVGTDAHTYYFDIPEITFNRSAQRSINVNLANAVIKEGVDLDAKALPYEEKFDVGMGEFTVEDITNPDGVTVWSHSNQSGSYMKASAFINSQRYETESMLVSPWIDLTTVSAANVSFDHAHRYAGTAANELTFWVKTDEAEAAWQKLTIPTYASGTNWTFVNSGNIDLSAFVGHNVKVAFKYISDGTNSGTSTWEINNFIVDKVKSEAGLAYATAEYTANVGEDFTAPTLTNPNNLTVTYSSSNENVALVDETTGEIVIGAAGVAVITASFAGNDDYYEGSASYTINVIDPNQKFPNPETIVFADLNLENAVQYSNPFDGGDFTVTFGGGGNDGKYYDTGTGIRTYSNGTIAVASTDYNIVRIDYTFSASGYAPGEYSINTGSLTTGAASVWTGSAKSVVLTNSASSGHWRLQSVKVTFGEATVAETYAVTWVIPDETGCLISATVNGSDIESGDEFEENTVVTITAIPGSGYIFNGWTINGASVADASAASTTFTVGNASVNFSAAFSETSGGGSVTFDFSSISETTTGGWNGSHTESPITIAATSANTNKAGQVRFQNGGTVTFSGATITRIEIINSGNYPGDFSANVGTYSLVGNNGVWTGSSSNVVLTNNGNGTRTTSIVVTYE